MDSAWVGRPLESFAVDHLAHDVTFEKRFGRFIPIFLHGGRTEGEMALSKLLPILLRALAPAAGFFAAAEILLNNF